MTEHAERGLAGRHGLLPTAGEATRVVHAGQPPDRATGAVVPPLYLASTFAQDGVGAPRGGYEYARSANPTRNAFEAALAELESPDGSAVGLAFASGLAASDTLLRTVLRPGDRVILGDDVYGGTFRLLTTSYADWGVTVEQVDLTDPGALDDALGAGGARLLWVETPTNPLLNVCDISAACQRAHAAGALVLVDNTFATPVLQKPLQLGADVVLHSVTKYLGGHSDLVAGALVLPRGDLADAVRTNQNSLGAVASPFDCWLAMRGLRTLGVRMASHCAGAALIAEVLAAHPQIAEVRYPGLPSHPGHAVAQRQMSAPGGMISIRPAGGPAVARRLAESTRLFTLAESLGGVESLIEVPAAMTHASSAASARPVPPDLVRLSVGIEDPQDLLADILDALGHALCRA
jgi:cystathionine gamma-synthase